MFQSKIPSSPRTYITRYDKFRGVDFRTDPSQVDANRSPWAPNLISDSGGKPEKRPGWRTIKQYEGMGYGLFDYTDGNTEILCHFDNKMYRGDDVLTEEMNTHKSMGVTLGKLWIVDGLNLWGYDGEMKKASDDAYVPMTVISRDPGGGGVTFEAINMLTPKRKNSFLADGTTKIYQLDAENIDEVISAKVNGEDSPFTVDLETGKVTFSAAPPVPSVTGVDNVVIEFSRTVDGYADRVNKCTIITVYGQGNDKRVFLSGNPDYPNYDFYCAFNDPTYMPDLNYTIIGSDRTRIMGYRNIYEAQAIIKEDNSQDYTIFIRTPDMLDGKMVFRAYDGVIGVGAIAPYAFCNLLDDPMFLSRSGVYSITSDNIYRQRTVARRSSFVDALLTKEDNLENAVAAQWKDYMVIAINNRCYVADARQKHYPRNTSDTFEYEWYYWDNIPISSMLELKGLLYFTTEDGRLCMFNSDMVDDRAADKILLMAAYNDDGEPIVAKWSTKADDDGDFMQYKTMIKKGSGVQLKPYARSSCKIYLRTEKDFGAMVKYEAVDIFDFADIDFERFTFNTLDTPQAISIRQRRKNYKTLQITVENDGVNEAFGIFAIIKRFTRGNLMR